MYSRVQYNCLLTVMVVTLIFISAKEGKSGSINNLVKSY